MDEKVQTTKRKYDKSKIPVCSILGVKIATIDMSWLVSYIENNILNLSGDYICVSNVHTTVTAFEDSEYRLIQNGGVMAIPDGGPLSTLGRHRGYSNMKRTTGPGLMEEIFNVSVTKEYRHFFYGSTPDTLKKLRIQLETKYPDILIVGMYSPPFRQLTDEEETNVINMINTIKPDFIWVGLGAPKQEIWMANHKDKVDGLMIGVGAGFDYFAKNISRAPSWMQRMNLEWLYRLLQDPKRLFKRYLITNTKFVWNAVLLGK